jgi:hypothetical protein
MNQGAKTELWMLELIKGKKNKNVCGGFFD